MKNEPLKDTIMLLTSLIRLFLEKFTGVVKDGLKHVQADSLKSQVELARLEEIPTPMRPILEEKRL
jgi:hypothetical protein